MGIRASDWEQVQTLLDQRRPETMDLIKVNGIPFATVSGIGVGALLANEFNVRRVESSFFRTICRYLKSQVYTVLSAKAILFQRSYLHDLHVKSDVFEERIRTGAMFICNQNYLGGDLRVSSLSENDDQKFRVLIIPRTLSNELITALVQMKLGNIPSDFILFSTDHLTITEMRGRPIRLFGDGEILTEKSELEFKIIPQGLKVYRDRSPQVQTRKGRAS